MNELLKVLGLVLVILLRIGLPAGITILIAWLLHRLDARWQEEAMELQKAGQVEWVPLSIRAPCWQLLNCPPETRDSCPAYAAPETPCWQVFRDRRGWLLEKCYACPVFTEAPLPFVVSQPAHSIPAEKVENRGEG